jgi:hypothetical protein
MCQHFDVMGIFFCIVEFEEKLGELNKAKDTKKKKKKEGFRSQDRVG